MRIPRMGSIAYKYNNNDNVYYNNNIQFCARNVLVRTQYIHSYIYNSKAKFHLANELHVIVYKGQHITHFTRQTRKNIYTSNKIEYVNEIKFFMCERESCFFSLFSIWLIWLMPLVDWLHFWLYLI